jgi:hypothetical protein
MLKRVISSIVVIVFAIVTAFSQLSQPDSTDYIVVLYRLPGKRVYVPNPFG